VLRKIFGLQRREVTENQRNLHNEEFHVDFSSSQALLGLSKQGG